MEDFVEQFAQGIVTSALSRKLQLRRKGIQVDISKIIEMKIEVVKADLTNKGDTLTTQEEAMLRERIRKLLGN